MGSDRVRRNLTSSTRVVVGDIVYPREGSFSYSGATNVSCGLPMGLICQVISVGSTTIRIKQKSLIGSTPTNEYRYAKERFFVME